MTDTDHLIWSNYHIDYEDWREYLEEEFPDLSEDERYLKMLEINNDYLDDERVNLDIQLSQPIIAIADLGLWFGRRCGYKEIQSGNIRDCLYSHYDYTTWYVDKLGRPSLRRCSPRWHESLPLSCVQRGRERHPEGESGR